MKMTGSEGQGEKYGFPADSNQELHHDYEVGSDGSCECMMCNPHDGETY